MSEQDDSKAGERMQVILDHLAGRMNATEAAAALSISRKTFYEWLERARTGMLQALVDRPTGRPAAVVDKEKENLAEAVNRLEEERAILQARLRLREAIQETLASSPRKKKTQGIEE